MQTEQYGSASKLTGEIVDGYCVRQSFTASFSDLHFIHIAFATYRRRNDGIMRVSVMKGEKEIARAQAAESKLLDNQFHKFEVNVQLVKGQEYEIKLHTQNARNGMAATAKWGAKRHKNSYFYNGTELVSDGELYLQFEYETEAKSSRRELDIPKLGEVTGLISVVIPAYNCSAYLDKCLNHLARQRYNCVEAVVVDDGSDDYKETSEIALAFDGHMSFRTRLVRHRTNKGACAARNSGATAARGEYIFFLDADTYLHEDAFMLMIEALLDNQNAAFSYCNFMWGDKLIEGMPFDIAELHRCNYISTMSLLRRSSFLGFDESLKRLQDWDLWLRITKVGSNGTWINETLFESEQRESSISTGEYTWEQANEEIRQKHLI